MSPARRVELVHEFEGSLSRHRDGLTLCVRCGEDRNHWWHDGWIVVEHMKYLLSLSEER